MTENIAQENSKPKEENSTDKNAIIIVGDWLIDEYWFLVTHHSDISSHPGRVHYRIASEQGEIISDLCGAGHVARILYELCDKKEKGYKLFGVGNWNEKDQKLIGHLVHAREKRKKCSAANASFRLTRDFCEDSPDINLYSLRPEGQTICVIRQYHQGFEGLEQINRVDWELKEDKSKDRSLQELQLPQEDQICAIVIHDLVKGVVTEDLIRELYERYPNVRWYVRSKHGSPAWLEIIKKSLELLVIGPEVALLMNLWQEWLSRGRITIQALETIRDLPGKNVVMLSDFREIIVRLGVNNNGNKMCVTGKSYVKRTPLIQLGWPSNLFGSLIHKMIGKSYITREDIESSLIWVDEHGGIPAPEISVVKTTEERKPDVRESQWEQEVNEWDQAMKGCGIIKKNDATLHLEVWRGSTHLPGYIACIREKQDIINRIAQKLIAFIKGGSQILSLSIMIQADPGSGKTFLAKSLANAFGFSFLQYDVTQMTHRDDLIDIFESVASIQASTNEKVLVFVDEINAFLESSHAYGAFLSPLEEGVYVRRGRRFSLKPCVWFFTGTKMDEDDLKKGEKLSDFKSRMTMMESIDYESLKSKHLGADFLWRLKDEARLEQVYLGATMIREYFSDVREISKEVLKQFHDMAPEEAPARKIRKFAGLLRNVQYGKVTRKNCENWEGIRWKEPVDKGDDQLVKLEFD